MFRSKCWGTFDERSTKKLTNVREQIVKANSGLAALETSLLSRLETENRVDQFISSQASLIRWPDLEFAQQGSAPTGIFTFLVDGRVNIAPALCGMFPGEVRNRILDKIDNTSSEFGPSTADRYQKAQELKEPVLNLETQEEALVVEIKESGA